MEIREWVRSRSRHSHRHLAVSSARFRSVELALDLLRREAPRLRLNGQSAYTWESEADA